MVKQVELFRSDKSALVDDEDYDLVSQYKWYCNLQGNIFYALRSITKISGLKSMQKMHILLTGFKMTDHQNGDGLDNRRINLRPTTYMLNRANSIKRRPGLSKYKGVTWSNTNRMWYVRVQVNGKRQHIGYYLLEEEAALAYDRAAIIAFGEHAKLNFPEVK